MDRSSDQIQRIEVKILVPQHVSAVPSLDASTRVLCVFQSHGVAWRGVFPLLVEAPPSICRRFLRILFQNTQESIDNWKDDIMSNKNKNDEDHYSWPGFFRRSIYLQNAPSTTILLQPPIVCHPDVTFSSVVIRTERLLLRIQTMTAWYSTLGGGYFFCRRLHVSLQLARQQRALALQIGNIPMARQCIVNEAYNLIYAGKFRAAKRVLNELEESVRMAMTKHGDEGGGAVTLRQCQAARLLAKRLKLVQQRGLRGYHTFEKGEKHAIDDFQRIRIVVEDGP